MMAMAGPDVVLTWPFQGTPNSVVSSYNRNFVGRHDGNPETHSFVTSPELVATLAFAGSLQYNPSKDTIPTQSGEQFSFSPPHVEELPTHFEDGTALYQAPPEDSRDIDVQVSPTSNNLQLLEPFEPWQEGQAENLSILIKVKGEQNLFLEWTLIDFQTDNMPRQVHHRSHLTRRPMVQVPRPPRKYLQQPPHRRRKRHRVQNPPRRNSQSHHQHRRRGARSREVLPKRKHRVVHRRRLELRRRIQS